MNWNEVAAVFAKEAGLPKALRDPETLRRLAAQLKSAPTERDQLAARSALLRTQAHARGRLASESTHRERKLTAAMDRITDQVHPTPKDGSWSMLFQPRQPNNQVPPDMISLGDRISDETTRWQSGGERSRAAGKALTGLVEPRPAPFRASLISEHESPETFLRRYYGRPAETPTAAGGASPPGGSRGSGGGGGGAGSGGSPASGGHAGRNIALALAGAALLGGGAYLWRRKRDREEAETPPERRWSTAGAAR